MADSTPFSGAATAAPGTPAWWAARPPAEPPTQPRRGRPRRSFERIVETAAELVDEVGIAAFNMRMLAERLGSSTAMLYRHVSGKDELMVFVVDRLLGEVAAPGERPRARGWQAAMRERALGFHRALGEHPNVLPLFVAQVPIGPNGLALRERTIGALVGFGFSPRLAARTYTTVAQYIIGFAAIQPNAPGPEEAAALGEFYRGLDPGAYPNTVAAADALTGISLEDEFSEGLQIILDGIDRARRR
jgi:AcrR family transcriptional regulator